MKTETLALVTYIFVIFSVISGITHRIKFKQSINYHTIELLKHKNFRAYSISGLLFGLLIIVFELFKFKNQSDIVKQLGFLCVVLVNLSSVLKYKNFTAIDEDGIWLENKKLKWEKIDLIDKDEYSFIISVKKTNHYIHFRELENEEEFKKSFIAGIKRYHKMEFNKIKI